MTRIVKNPEDRREELIQVAVGFFAKQGYEETTVSDIVREINVGQGTFYHYFRSKEDILGAVAEKQVAPLVEELSRITKDDTNPPLKVNAMLNSFLRASSSEMGFMGLMHKKGNHLLHQKILEILTVRVLPIITETVSKGAAQGHFNTECPEESITFLLFSVLLLSPHFSSNLEGRVRMRTALENITARVLGVTDYRFHLEV
ncbi:MAG: TetR/AcrR family transcriptional regulator [Methanothrix sp.]|jgi:AcrR family transcriptional regulator|nr:TetR/AcrR family transcriptional regulator [Methanothrix sp.]